MADPDWQNTVRGAGDAVPRPGEPVDADTEAPAQMTFLDHLEELRGTLVRSALAFVVAASLIVFFLQRAAQLLNWPLEVALGSENAMVSEGLVTTGPMAVFAVIFQVTFMGALAIALPFILYFVARFIAPGLTPKELALLRPTCLAALSLFLLGAGFSFFILAPMALKASLYFNDMFNFKILWSADRYYGMLTWMTVGVGILFEFPLLIIAAVAVGLVDTVRLRHYRPHSIVVILALAAIITPTTDPLTFLLLAIPMSILYQGAIVVGGVIERRRARAAELAEETDPL